MVLVTWYRAIKLHCWNPGHGLSFHAYIFLLIWLQLFNKFNFEEATNKLLTKTEGDWYTHLGMMTQIILQWQMHWALNIQHHVVLLPITCVLVGAESWQRGATKNGKVLDDAKKQEHKRLMIDDNPILKRWYGWKMILPKASELKTHPHTPHTPHTTPPPHTKNKPTISTSTILRPVDGILITIKQKMCLIREKYNA